MQRINNDPNGTTSASEFDVNYVHIYTYNSELPIDITKMVNYIEVFESIYTPFITLNINITDTLSLNNILPFIGEEFIELDVRGPDGQFGIIKEAFYIYRLSDRMAASDKAFIYTLHCISSAAIADMNLKISQSMSGQPSDIVKTKLANAMVITKTMYSHPTKNAISYISNYWTPMQNINYICERAVSKDTSSASYLFYETIKQFNFVPLDALVAQEANFTYFYAPNTHIPGIESQQMIIHNLYVDETFNYLNRLMDGAYGNRTLTVNPTRKSYSYNYYDFLESYDKHSRLNTLPFATGNAPRRINSVFRTKISPSQSIPTMDSDRSSEWHRQRLTELAAINSQSINIDVIGRFNLNAGNVIEVVVPVSDISNSESEENGMRKSFDRTLSGRYLVTSIKRLLTRERHTMTLQASKDSMLDIRK